MPAEQLKKYCKQFVAFTEDELSLVDKYFTTSHIKKNGYILKGGTICNAITFINKGIVRHFHIKDGIEKTCDISRGDTFVTDFTSFTKQELSEYNFQALTDTEVTSISRDNLYKLYDECHNYETLGRIMAEQTAQRAIQIAKTLSSDKPEERYIKLVSDSPELFQLVPQKYIANFLGVSPESLSRIRNRITKQKS